MDKAVRDGYALQLLWNQIEKKLLHQSIQKLIYDESYIQNIRKRQSLLRDQTETPLERGIYWAEYIARHKGAEHLHLGSRQLNRLQRSLIDVYVVLIMIGCILAVVSWLCLRRVSTLVTRSEYFVRLLKFEVF